MVLSWFHSFDKRLRRFVVVEFEVLFAVRLFACMRIRFDLIGLGEEQLVRFLLFGCCRLDIRYMLLGLRCRCIVRHPGRCRSRFDQLRRKSRRRGWKMLKVRFVCRVIGLLLEMDRQSLVSARQVAFGCELYNRDRTHCKLQHLLVIFSRVGSW